MSETGWEITKIYYCDRAGMEVALETQLVFPADLLPEQKPRIRARRCSRAMQCQNFQKPACIWAGSNPDFDPFEV